MRSIDIAIRRVDIKIGDEYCKQGQVFLLGDKAEGFVLSECYFDQFGKLDFERKEGQFSRNFIKSQQNINFLPFNDFVQNAGLL